MDKLDNEQKYSTKIPPEIGDSLHRFMEYFGPNDTIAFLMMRFTNSRPHNIITETIKRTCAKAGITVHRVDDREFHSDLYWNIMTYCYGCQFGIAVYDRIETESFNANISYEVGYLHALGKPVCILKDKNIDFLHYDLIGKLYRKFDPYDPESTLPPALNPWLEDHGFYPDAKVSKNEKIRANKLKFHHSPIKDSDLEETRILQRLIQGVDRKDIALELGTTIKKVYSVYNRNRSIL